MAIASRLVGRYRRLTRAQRMAVAAIAVGFGAYIPMVIRVTGVTRTHRGTDLRGLCAVFVAVVTVVVGLFAVTAPGRAAAGPGFVRPRRVLAYAALPFAVFCVYLVAFYPALMTDDSYCQWDQIVSGKFNASLPFAHTLLYWVAASFWKSPAAPALAQSLALALAFGASMVELGRSGAPRWLTWVLTGGFALLPLNGAMAVSLWKDIAFSAAILWLTIIVFRIVVSGGEAARERRTMVQLAAALALVTLIRPNGPVPALVTASVLLGCYPRVRRPVLIASAGALLVILFVNVGLARATGETFDGAGVYEVSPFIYDIGAILRADLLVHRRAVSMKPGTGTGRGEPPELGWRNRRVTQQERDVLARFDNVIEWAALYQPNHYPYWHTHLDHWKVLDDPAKRDELMRVWFALARRNPGIVFHHRIATARIGWQIDADDYNATVFAFAPQADRLGYAVDPPSPSLTTSIEGLLAKVLDPHLTPFIAYPALVTYSTLLLFGFEAVRRRSWRFLAVATPLASNWLATLAFCMAQDARYFYAAFVVFPFACGLPWTAAVDGGLGVVS
jgi:hypothetical protein